MSFLNFKSQKSEQLKKQAWTMQRILNNYQEIKNIIPI